MPRSVFTRFAALTALSVAAAACGGGADDEVVIDDTVPPVEVTDGEPDAPEMAASELVLAAFSNLGEGRGFRVTSTSAQTNKLPALGQDVAQEIDPTRPTVVSELAANGDTHTVLDLGTQFEAIAASADAATRAALDGVGLEMWIVGDTLVIDSTSYQVIADLNPTFDLGPFQPGVGFIDLGRARELGSDELVAAIAGEGVVNPVQLAATLPATLDGITIDPDDSSVFHATTDFATLTEATGGDITNLARSLAVGMAASLGASVDDLAGVFERAYRRSATEVTLTIGESGVLETMRADTDLSAVYEEMFDSDSGLDIGASDDELEQARSLFAGAVLRTETLTTFALDDSIVVTLPAGDLEDRTDVALEFFAELLPS